MRLRFAWPLLLLALLAIACDDTPEEDETDAPDEDTCESTQTCEADVDADLAADVDADLADAQADQDADSADMSGLDALDIVDERAPCADSNPLRNVYFGDLHVHTALSFDAYVFDIRNSPDDAYRFAKGEPVGLPPLNADGTFENTLQLERPLDFAAVTDHSEYYAEVQSCLDPDSPAYNVQTCIVFRNGGNQGIFFWGFNLTNQNPKRFSDICNDNRVNCALENQRVWQRIQQVNEDHYDRTEACSFTTFNAYEYSNATGVSNYHRNVIFRNASVPAETVSYFDERSPWGLWDRLQEGCLDNAPCEVLAIPHNTNWSNGNMFVVEYPDAETVAEEAELAAWRARIEPLIEIYQHKGDSECKNGLDAALGQPDELCDFEKLRREPDLEVCPDDEPGSGAMAGIGCISRLDFVRGILRAGLEEEARIGVNPYKLGVIASTDTHNGIPGAVAESNWLGHWGNNEDLPEKRLTFGDLTPGGVLFSAGGLTAIWAEENSRDALFDAMVRKETYGTSGPRITVRFFGGWDYPADLCSDPDLVQVGYDQGVPMGGDLSEAPAPDAAPTFVISALQDPGTATTPGTPLQRLQVIKGWRNPDGTTSEAIYEVAGDPNNGASVDLDTCQPQGAGFDALCAVWRDPDFDATQNAFYYVRVLENPTCRWSTWDCIGIDPAERPDVCSDPEVPDTVQERAWTSPIWYAP